MLHKAWLISLMFLLCGSSLRARTHVRTALRMEATAFSNWKRPTAAGTATHEGVAAADVAVLPLGTVIRVRGAGRYSGRYTVTDTGSKVQGRHIDLFIPSRAEAKQFGKKMVRVRVLHTGTGRQDAREKGCGR